MGLGLMRAVAAVCLALTAIAAAACGTTGGHSDAITTPSASSFPTPIRRVVVIYQENHSFDNVLGVWCRQTARCNGATSGRLPGGAVIKLRQASDLVPPVKHESRDQTIAVDGGRMDGFANIQGCDASTWYACLTQFAPSQIPNLITLASRFTVSDATFEAHAQPSWGAHLELVAGQIDGFTGDNPFPSKTGAPPKAGWGCDSNMDAIWKPAGNAHGFAVPACVPQKDGSGPYRSSPVPWIPTVMDRMGAAHLSWRIYATAAAPGSTSPIPYGWALCPTFADCIDTGQRTNMVPSGRVLTDAQIGRLPNLSLVIPSVQNSQHNLTSMRQGDNWIGRVVAAIENGPQWRSTTIFIAYDDCGCFYDHVPPPAGLGIRVPVVIVSPYARLGYTATTPPRCRHCSPMSITCSHFRRLGSTAPPIRIRARSTTSSRRPPASG